MIKGLMLIIGLVALLGFGIWGLFNFPPISGVEALLFLILLNMNKK